MCVPHKEGTFGFYLKEEKPGDMAELLIENPILAKKHIKAEENCPATLIMGSSFTKPSFHGRYYYFQRFL